jgi:pilus assembly protein CpaF
MSGVQTGLDAGLVQRVRDALVASNQPPSAAHVATLLREQAGVLGDAAVLEATELVRHELLGAGPLEELLAEPDVTDVLVNGPGEIWVDDGAGLRLTEVRFPSESAVRRLAVRIAAAAGRRLDEASPFVDLLLDSGTRVHVALPPIAPDGPLISVRIPPRRLLTLDDLVALGWAPTSFMPWVRAMVCARLGFLVSGGTGSGKTTVLSVLLSQVSGRERILLIEDSGELQPQHPHVVRLQSRPANLEGAGAVTLRDLVRQGLRMRPDRIVIGEVRGGEVADWLAAMNTGHAGCCATVHANRPEDVPARLEALGVAAGLDRQAVHSQATAALDVVLHLTRDSDGRRRLGSVGVVSSCNGWLRLLPAFVLTGDGGVVPGDGFEMLRNRLDGVVEW